MTASLPSAAPSSRKEQEEGSAFAPKFDEAGLLPAIVSDAVTGEVLMFAFMNAEALSLTLASGYAHFWSRSRGRIWQKGEESGNRLKVIEIRTDCDQDVIWVRSTVEGDGVACHTGRWSCFYRRVTAAGGGGQSLSFVAESGSTAGGASGDRKPRS